MTFPTCSPEFSMIYLKISEIFHANVSGKYRAKGTIFIDHRSLPYTAGCLRGTTSPPAGPGHGLGGGPGGEVPGNPENTAFWSTKIGKKTLTFSRILDTN